MSPKKLSPHRRDLLLALVTLFGVVLLGFWVRTLLPQPASQAIPEVQVHHLPIVSDSMTPVPELRMLVVGDIMLGRFVESLMARNGSNYPFAQSDSLLAHHDYVLGNLEGPIPATHVQTPTDVLQFNFPSTTPTLLVEHHISDVSLANNHAYDAGPDGFAHTREVLKSEGIQPIGDARSTRNNCETISETDASIVICAFSIFTGFDDVGAVKAIADERERHPKAFLLVMPHWGVEYALHSNSEQQRRAHAFLDAGADAVIGGHPHVVQELEIYHDRPIFYSLGNFIFDQYFSDDVQQELAVDLTIGETSVTYALHALQSIRSQPREMDDQGAEKFFSSLAQRSGVSFSGSSPSFTFSRQE